jgi:hypothetical protein
LPPFAHLPVARLLYRSLPQPLSSGAALQNYLPLNRDIPQPRGCFAVISSGDPFFFLKYGAGGDVCNRPVELALKEVELPGSSRSDPPRIPSPLGRQKKNLDAIKQNQSAKPASQQKKTKKGVTEEAGEREERRAHAIGSQDGAVPRNAAGTRAERRCRSLAPIPV